MNLELFIAKKIHFSKEGDREVTPPAVRIAMIGIALGLAVMILSVAIVIGFKNQYMVTLTPAHPLYDNEARRRLSSTPL